MRVFAPAKVNLALHVTGRRDDGYHLLDSLVVFAGIGDWLDVVPAPELRLNVTGPRADGVPVDRSNLIWRAVESFEPAESVSITLEKHLPMAGGIGGGSADAAAAIRAVCALRDRDLPDMDRLLALGADLPVCVAGSPARMQGIGEALSPLPPLPPLWIVLVNPGVEVPTGAVFSALQSVQNAPLAAPDWSDTASLFGYLRMTRNDLQAAATELAPQVADVLAALADDTACHFSRMSGSGGTCFGLYTSPDHANAAAERISGTHSRWWAAAGPVLNAAP